MFIRLGPNNDGPAGIKGYGFFREEDDASDEEGDEASSLMGDMGATKS